MGNRKRKSLTDAAKEARRAYQREWRRKNPERVQAIQRRYWERRARKADEAKEAGNGN